MHLESTNYIKHLKGVFLLFSKDGRLNPTHISLYIALFQLWNKYHFPEEFYINREEVMRFSKIGSKSTYHRCIKELCHWKYIVYMPSHNPFRGSQIKMFQFGISSGQALYLSQNHIETSIGQAEVSKRKHKQTISNHKNENKQGHLNLENSQPIKKLNSRVPYQDHLKTSPDKNYDEPL